MSAKQDFALMKARQEGKRRMSKCVDCGAPATDIDCYQHRILPVCAKHQRQEGK